MRLELTFRSHERSISDENDPPARKPFVSFKLRELESNGRTPGSEPGVTTNNDCPASTSRIGDWKSALRESNPPRQVGSLEPLPLGQEHMFSGESLLSRRLQSVPGLSFREAAEAGIEPASGRVTTVCPYQHEHHRIDGSVRMAGFEPAVSCSRSTRSTRLSHTLRMKSAQWESNPHIRHGKAVGCRYIMGAQMAAELSKIENRSR